MKSGETGNPVFDYRAGFRRRAAAVQSALLILGAVGLPASGILRIAGVLTTVRAEELAAAAIAIFVAGFAWGIYWRRALRADFRQTFGPECATGGSSEASTSGRSRTVTG